MTDAAIRSASECPCNEGTANFTVDSKSYRYPWVVGLIQIETRSIGCIDPEAFQNHPPRYRFEDFVVVYDDLGNERASFPRRCAMVEYFPAEQEQS